MMRRDDQHKQILCHNLKQQNLKTFSFSSFLTSNTILTTNKYVKNVHPVYGARIWTHNLCNMSHLP